MAMSVSCWRKRRRERVRGRKLVCKVTNVNRSECETTTKVILSNSVNICYLQSTQDEESDGCCHKLDGSYCG